MLMPNKYPINAVSPIAIVPQTVIRKMAFLMLEPPVFAAMAPKIIRKIIEKPYKKYSILFTGANKVTSKGKTPPAVNAVPEASAA